ncbi:MAG TPA: carboxylating nicotinate-nucleotide diphosphorylase [Bacteroidales bacterium]|nr:carboxylating nicotinate-nucleotide diphosphorylase [Bacteroidales bacterium]
MNADSTIDKLIELAIAEDFGDGDHTSQAIIPADVEGKAMLLIKEEGILAGLDIARKVFRKVNAGLVFEPLMNDGDQVKPGDKAFMVSGSARSILSAERLVLNYMQRMSGIATSTRHYVSLIGNSGTKLLDTRKTTPNNRIFEKMAVAIGGGYNHRFGLFDMVMIKNNHVDFAGGIDKAINAVRTYLDLNGKNLDIEVEVRNFEELAIVLQCGGIKRIMLDNFSPAKLSEAVKMIDGRYETEASGGITESTIAEYAATGVDFISVGALTHQIRSLDMSLRAIA